MTGLGEFLGYGFRLVSGRWADATGLYWPIIICGYLIQMTSVPALAFTRSWEACAALIILERLGKAMRNPPRDAMLAHAGKRVGGYGSVFGIHEALDQLGAMFGPLLVAFILARGGNFHEAFAVLAVPAAINLALVATARAIYPRPADLEASQAEISKLAMRGCQRSSGSISAGRQIAKACLHRGAVLGVHRQLMATHPGGTAFSTIKCMLVKLYLIVSAS